MEFIPGSSQYCTWLESPKAVRHAGSYCKLVAHTVVELWQHKISNIIRTKIIQLQGSIAKELKRLSPLQMGGLQSPSLSALIWCRLYVHSTLCLRGTGTQTYIHPSEALANEPCLTHSCFLSHVITKCSESNAFPPKHLILSRTFHCMPHLE